MIRINRLARTTFDLFAIFKQIVEPRLNFVHCRVTMQIAAALSRPGFDSSSKSATPIAFLVR